MRIVSLIFISVLMLGTVCNAGNNIYSEVNSTLPEQDKDCCLSAFLDQKREVDPELEWNREIVSSTGGTFLYRVSAQGPIAITIITDKGYKALMSGDREAFDRKDVIITMDVDEPPHMGRATVPSGSSWFIIKNRSDRRLEIHLQCFGPKQQ